jgi:hypothetical protein
MTESRRMRRKGHVAHMGVRIGTYRVLMGRIEHNRPLGRASSFPVFRQKRRVSLKSILIYIVF